MPEVGAAYSLLQPNTDSEFKWIATEEGADYPEHEGAAVWTRPDLARATHAKAMKELHGVRIVAELDDNYLNPAISEGGYVFNYFMHVNKMDATARMDHMKSCASMDGIIVTSEYLRDLYHATLKAELHHCPDIFVCGNHIELDRWPRRVESKSGKLRVGFMGSPSHRLDIKLAFPAFKWAYDAGHEIVFIGYDPQWRRFMDYTHIPWTDSTSYRAEGLPLDVGLAPLRHDRHTLGKTDIKAMEYLMSGAVPICSNMPVYNRTFRHNETALLAGSRKDLLEQTVRACTDPRLRERILDEGCQYIRENRDITKHADEWRQAVCGD